MQQLIHWTACLVLILATSACTSAQSARSQACGGARLPLTTDCRHLKEADGRLPARDSIPENRSRELRQGNTDPSAGAIDTVAPTGSIRPLCLPELSPAAWRESPEAMAVFPRPPRPSCAYSIELAVAADDAWEVFVGGQKMVPTNGSSETYWHVPALYTAVVPGTGSSLVVGIHANDVSGVASGLLAHVRVERLSPPSNSPPWVFETGAGTGWYAFQPSSLSPAPPLNWNTAQYLPFASATQADWAPATPASACLGSWGGSAAFLNNWTAASGGATPTGWVWESDCEVGAASWREENWYRLEIPLDYCPADTPPPPPDGACCTWTLTAHGAADGLFDTQPVPGCTTNMSSSSPTAYCIDRIGCGWIPSLCKYRCGFDLWWWNCV